MQGQDQNQQASSKRQAAYSIRNRARLIHDAQEVLAVIGLEATMEQVAAHIGVSPTTIYKYFGSKEALLSEAFLQIWEEWLTWSHEAETPCESLESLVVTSRKFVRVKQTHPFFGKVLRKVLGNSEFLVNELSGPSKVALRSLAKKGEIAGDDLDIKVLLWSQAEAGIFSGVHATEVLTPTEADYALGLSLKLFNVSDDKIEKWLSKDLKLTVATSE